jgi:hypothetical protein
MLLQLPPLIKLLEDDADIKLHLPFVISEFLEVTILLQNPLIIEP